MHMTSGAAKTRLLICWLLRVIFFLVRVRFERFNMQRSGFSSQGHALPLQKQDGVGASRDSQRRLDKGLLCREVQTLETRARHCVSTQGDACHAALQLFAPPGTWMREAGGETCLSKSRPDVRTVPACRSPMPVSPASAARPEVPAVPGPEGTQVKGTLRPRPRFAFFFFGDEQKKIHSLD